MNHHNGKYARNYLKRMQRAFEDSSLKMDDLRLHWYEAWQRHYADLRSYFVRRNNFLHSTFCSLNSKLRFAVFYVDGAIASAERHCLTLELVQRSPKTMSEVLATIADHRYLGPPALAL